MTDWNQVYSGSADYFGGEPDPLLPAHADRLDHGRPVLDVGAGQGRNTLYLAERGFAVLALDPSDAAMRYLRAEASRRGLDVTVQVGYFAGFSPGAGVYGTVLALGLIPILRRAEVDRLAERIAEWISPGGLALVTAFTTADPSHDRYAGSGREIGKQSFELPDGNLRTFLDPDEAPNLFRGFEVLHHHEGMGPEHRHCDGPVHRHGVVSLVLQREGRE